MLHVSFSVEILARQHQCSHQSGMRGLDELPSTIHKKKKEKAMGLEGGGRDLLFQSMQTDPAPWSSNIMCCQATVACSELLELDHAFIATHFAYNVGSTDWHPHNPLHLAIWRKIYICVHIYKPHSCTQKTGITNRIQPDLVACPASVGEMRIFYAEEVLPFSLLLTLTLCAWE